MVSTLKTQIVIKLKSQIVTQLITKNLESQIVPKPKKNNSETIKKKNLGCDET